MELKFESNLDYQLTAIESTVNLFSGQPRIQRTSPAYASVPNSLDLTEKDLLNNLQTVQTSNGFTKTDDQLYCITENIETTSGLQEIKFYNFSIEMETGTGKTYVYIRTIMELYQKYGMRKFIVVVPSIAIREGVLKTFQITENHFKTIYGSIPVSYYAYNSENLTQVRQFALSDSVEIMVMTLAAFNKAVNVIHQSTDRLLGDTPVYLIQSVRPILILDEPQNMESEKSISALAVLNPLFALRYSATHRNPYNKIYRLSPYEAYRQNLVKKIEVASVLKEDDTALPFIRLEGIETKKHTLKVRMSVHKLMKAGQIKERTIIFNQGDALKNKTDRNEYEGYDIVEINKTGNFVRFANGLEIVQGQELGTNKAQLFEAQIRYTIEEHIRKQQRLKNRGIKVLSLFFIDKVENFVQSDGIIKQILNRIFSELKGKNPDWANREVEEVTASYFAARKTRGGETIYLDSVTGDSEKDLEAYELIMKKKEELLSLTNPVEFIFSHSALREGWDNPNVFQICTLNQTISEVKKRQEIGRGIRLAVDQTGNRVREEAVNVLTVVCNESYERYVSALQSEIDWDIRKEIEARYGKPYEQLTKSELNVISDEYGETFRTPKPANARKRGKATLNKARYLSPEFKALWEKIKHKTRYAVKIDSQKLIDDVAEELNEVEIRPPSISITKISIDIDTENRYDWLKESKSPVLNIADNYPIPNVLTKISFLLQFTTPKISLTRRTLLEIIKKTSEKTQKAMISNPNEFANICSQKIKEKIADQLVDGIKYTKINDWYEMTQFIEEIESWEDYLQPVGHSIYDNIIFNSNVERVFAEELERRSDVLVYVKLPSWFTVKTPVGDYNPDWAVLRDEKDAHGDPTGKRLYLVYETKGSINSANLRGNEGRKIRCGMRHFKDELKLDDFKPIDDPRLM